ncbi:uncharacterized protein VTP21DRAFT_1980 [Calcarisporiella thermophila]|uniref:uncharacterized protein n=1 Tax=Calcarisporiella thermophila TaxID=911321 RepID=UPI003742F9CC
MGEVLSLPCPYCNNAFVVPETLVDHIKTEHKDKPVLHISMITSPGYSTLAKQGYFLQVPQQKEPKSAAASDPAAQKPAQPPAASPSQPPVQYLFNFYAQPHGPPQPIPVQSPPPEEKPKDKTKDKNPRPWFSAK